MLDLQQTVDHVLLLAERSGLKEVDALIERDEALEVEIRDGKARILKSPCKNKVCIKSGYIRYADRLSACIPNRVVVRVLGDNHRGVDSIVS